MGCNFPLVVVLEFERFHLELSTLIEIVQLREIQITSLQLFIKLREIDVEDLVILKVEVAGREAEFEALPRLIESNRVLLKGGLKVFQQVLLLFGQLLLRGSLDLVFEQADFALRRQSGLS